MEPLLQQLVHHCSGHIWCTSRGAIRMQGVEQVSLRVCACTVQVLRCTKHEENSMEKKLFGGSFLINDHLVTLNNNHNHIYIFLINPVRYVWPLTLYLEHPRDPCLCCNLPWTCLEKTSGSVMPTTGHCKTSILLYNGYSNINPPSPRLLYSN